VNAGHGSEGGHRSPSPAFTGTRRHTAEDGNVADIRYVDGAPVEITIHAPDGAVLQRIYADDRGMPTTRTVIEGTWPEEDSTS
jgi:hypothetical protein